MPDVKEQLLAYVKSVSIEEASRVFDLPPSRIKRWKSGERSPSADDLQNFVDWKAVSADKPTDRQEITAQPMAGVPNDIDDNRPIMQRKAEESGQVYVSPAQRQAPKKVASRERIDDFNPLPPEMREELDTMPPEGAVPTKVADKRVSNLMTESQYKSAMSQVRDGHQEALPPKSAPPIVVEPVQVPVRALVPTISPAQGADMVYEPSDLMEAIDYIAAHKETIDPAIIMKMRDVFFNFKGRDVCLCIPFLKQTNPGTAVAIAAIAMDLGKERMSFKHQLGDGVIANSRNKLAEAFLKETNCPWSFWIDDDMIPPIGRSDLWKYMTHAPKNYPDKASGMHCVERLLSHKKYIVGGTYYGRTPEGAPMFHEAMFDKEAHMAARNVVDGIRKTDWVGTGCMLIHRQVFLDIQKTQPELAPVTERSMTRAIRKEWDFFRMTETNGEDVSFCARARAAGHEIFIDTGLQVAHIGYASYCGWNTDNGVK